VVGFQAELGVASIWKKARILKYLLHSMGIVGKTIL
jgi:hypothetical protein